MQIQEIEARSVLVPSKLPDADYVVNPYTGCEFGCLYCYASFMGRLVNEPTANWGNYVYVKTNAVSVFADELRRWSPERRTASLLLSSVTDGHARGGGSSDESNLWLACSLCNRYKGDRTHGQDPVTGRRVRLFHPRRQRWHRHFRWSADGTEILGHTVPQVWTGNRGGLAAEQ